MALYVFFASWIAMMLGYEKGLREEGENTMGLLRVLHKSLHDWEVAYKELEAQLPKRGAKGRFCK